ncbi:MAG: GTPase HflX [Euryarchaeota archaeon RBG_13_31_8]|nr:MAG: GTPase HflX [Euryarchaeota archaeon RBG_13_31_8]
MKESYENAIVISLKNDISEIKDLADSLNYNIINSFIQHRENPDVNSYIGRGKVDEIIKFLESSEKKINLIIVDGELKPSQWFNLEKKFNIDVYDRTRLILAIFEKRAEKKEAKLQVKLAQLQYEKPFVRELIHRARSGEHPGFMAGGEYQVDDYYETIKKQVKRIKEELENIRNQREVRRRHRHTGGFYLVSLAGYTNAGKSSLLNLLSHENIYVEDKLFSTLSTTTRKINGANIPILLTDTVGFIKNLPVYIIDAFHSTLEEIEVADVVLLIVDVSEKKEIIVDKLKVSIDELIEIGVTSQIIITLNKTDLISNEELDDRLKYLTSQGLTENKKIIAVSIKNQYNIEKLLDLIYESLPQLVKFKIKLPINKETQSFISWIYEKAHVLEISYDESVIIYIESNTKLKEKIISRSMDLKGQYILD